MKLKVENDNLILADETIVRGNAIDWYDIEIEFDEKWNNLDKTIIYVLDEKVYKQPILDNKTVIPSLPSGIYSIGIVGTRIENETVIQRAVTNLLTKKITISSGEYEPNQSSEDIDATTYEKYLKLITEKANEIHNDIEIIELDKEQIAIDKLEMMELKEATKGYSELAQEYVSAVTFSTFEVDLDETGKLYVVNSEKLGNAGFYINEKGELEVENG